MKKSTIQSLVQTTFRTVETISPALAGKWGIKLFFTPIKRKRPEHEQDLIKDAEIKKFSLNGKNGSFSDIKQYTAYSWGEGPTVLLVHGWGGRGSQMASFARPLVDAGYKVIAFDAFAHGDSTGKQTNLIEVSQIIKHIEENSDGLHAIVGHSFGGVVAAFAVNEGINTNKLVTIGSPSSMDYIMKEFANIIHASDKTIGKIINYLENNFYREVNEFSLTHLVSRLDMSGLIIHDKQDRDVKYTEALALSKYWEGSELITTEGLGHRRILNDADTITQVVNFIQNDV